MRAEPWLDKTAHAIAAGFGSGVMFAPQSLASATGSSGSDREVCAGLFTRPSGAGAYGFSSCHSGAPHLALLRHSGTALSSSFSARHSGMRPFAQSRHSVARHLAQTSSFGGGAYSFSSCHSGARHLARARIHNHGIGFGARWSGSHVQHQHQWLWIPGPRYARPGMTAEGGISGLCFASPRNDSRWI
jgi:hypothetical protein